LFFPYSWIASTAQVEPLEICQVMFIVFPFFLVIREWLPWALEGLFPGGPTVVKFHFAKSKLREQCSTKS